MRRSKASSATFGRLLVALLCALAMTLGLIGHSQARGAKAVQPAKSVAYVLGVVQSGATQPPTNAACPYAALVSGAVAHHEALMRPRAEMRPVSYRLDDDVSSSSNPYGTPFRPPRAV
jgi:hypothetical protein